MRYILTKNNDILDIQTGVLFCEFMNEDGTAEVRWHLGKQTEYLAISFEDLKKELLG